ncbi:uncharacterized protein A1O9_08050 [Exophiala aquamarina CBS 119918]|uniref:Phenazine biosynthesis protein n=1 Tax=Exophiala aquamarina CBS 119918 TaxID=1182545 RepID=A0A072P8N5_9EURO|nr:uncharacterized protein A1O9_08050 [Exophiala aquamarina CBS 119918]KEF56469.1 hypothetical protein A1O9_08050 [Exophiala aquamarina CBS 119918]
MTGNDFKGNPTPVFVLDEDQNWPVERVLQAIAREMNQSETIFVKPAAARSRGTYDIRSFTPFAEEPFCGHGIVGAAIALEGRCDQGNLTFQTVGGIFVHAESLGRAETSSGKRTLGQVMTVKLRIPSVPVTEPLDHDLELRERMAKAIEIAPLQILALGRNSLMDLVVEVDSTVDFSADTIKIDAGALMKGSPPGTRSQIITSQGRRDGVDFLKRVFAYGSEDQATGSTHCVLAPYWGSKLGKSCMKAKQVSERTGEAEVESIVNDGGGHVGLTGSGVLIMEGRILVPRVARFDTKL